MNGRFYIDGIDAYQQFGVFVAQGGYRELVAYPSLKAPATNEWQEDNGAEVELSDPKLDKHEFAMSFGFSGGRLRAYEFYSKLCEGAYHTYEFAEIGLEFALRVIGNPSFNHLGNCGTMTVKLCNDFPKPLLTIGDEFQVPAGTNSMECDYWLGDFGGSTPYLPTSIFGVKVLQGTLDEVMIAPDVKKNLEAESKYNHGAAYDDYRVTHKPKDVKVRMLARASTLQELWTNYYGLLYYLTLPSTRMFHCEELMRSYECYYKSCTVNAFHPYDKWLDFTLKLCFTDFEAEDYPILLMAENNEFVATESNQMINILENYGNTSD